MLSWFGIVSCKHRFRGRSDDAQNRDDRLTPQDDIESGRVSAAHVVNPIDLRPFVDQKCVLSSVPENAISGEGDEFGPIGRRACCQPSNEIWDLFRQEHLPMDAAHQLTDPAGLYAFSDLVQLCKHVTEKDLRDVGMQIAPARELLEKTKPGGSIHLMLSLQQRLASCDGGNPNDGSSSSDSTSSSGDSRHTEMTAVMVPRRIHDNVAGVTPQIYHQHKLSEKYNRNFSSLTEAFSHASGKRDIGPEEIAYLKNVNRMGNIAKHEAFGQEVGPCSRSHQSSSSSAPYQAQSEHVGRNRDRFPSRTLGKCGVRTSMSTTNGGAPRSLDNFVGFWEEEKEGHHVRVNASGKVEFWEGCGKVWYSKLKRLDDGSFVCGPYTLEEYGSHGVIWKNSVGTYRVWKRQ